MLARLVENHVPNAHTGGNARGVHIDFNWFAAVCAENSGLATEVLITAGFVPANEGRWNWGNGGNSFSKLVHAEAFAHAVSSILSR